MMSKLKGLTKKLYQNILSKPNWFSLLAGLSLVFSYAPFSQWWLPFIVLPLWLHTIRQENRKNVTKQTYIFSFAWFTSGLSWIHISIEQFGGLPLIVSLLIMALLCLYLAIYPSLALYLSIKFARDEKLNLWLIPFFWLICEYLRGVVLTGFPWLSLGYSQIDSPFSVFAPVIGEVGLTFLLWTVVITILAIAYNIRRYLHVSLLIVIILITFILHQISWLTPTGKSIKTALIQGNIAQEMKWAPEKEWPTMLKYLDLSRANYDAELIIWPESAVTGIEPIQRVQDFLNLANQAATLNNSAIITGILNYNFESRQYFNSLIVLGQKNKDDTEGDYYYNNPNKYYKNHLLPIGEFVPFQEWLRPLAPLFNLPQSSFSRGDYVQKNIVARGLNILPLICFEVAFPAQLSANMTNKTDILLTVSNDAWFKDSHGPHQHLEIARMRALEFGRPLLRATNNGVTAAIDHLGKITITLPQFKEEVLKTDVKLVSGQTPYSRWGQFIHYLLVLFALIIALTSNKSSKSN